MFKVEITTNGVSKKSRFATIEEARNFAQQQHISYAGYINDDIQTWQGEDRTRLNGIAGRRANYTVAVFVELCQK